MNKNIFKFEVTDKFDKFCYAKSIPLVDFILLHKDFLPYLCEVLTSFYSINSIHEIGRRGKTRFDIFIKTLDFDNEDNNLYIDEFKKIILNAYDIESHYPNESYDGLQERLSKVRGTILELLMEKIIRPRFEASREFPNRIFAKGCKIIFYGKELTLSNRVSVDIAGWDGECGEFYEMKVGPKNFDETVLKLLSYIKTELDKKKVNNIVGCITMVNKNKLETQIESVRQNYGVDIFNNSIKIFGKQELLSLANRENIFRMLN